jgi:hypothetical protein
MPGGAGAPGVGERRELGLATDDARRADGRLRSRLHAVGLVGAARPYPRDDVPGLGRRGHAQLGCEHRTAAAVDGERLSRLTRGRQATDELAVAALTQPILLERPLGPLDRRARISGLVGAVREAFERDDEPVAVLILCVQHPFVREVGQQGTRGERDRLAERRGVADGQGPIELFDVDLAREVGGDPDAGAVAREVHLAPGRLQRAPDAPQCAAQRRPCARVEHVRPEAGREARPWMEAGVKQQVGEHRAGLEACDRRNRRPVDLDGQTSKEFGAQHGLVIVGVGAARVNGSFAGH